MKTRLDGDWEGWLKFFLIGVKEVFEEAANSASKIIILKETILKKLFDKKVSSIYAVEFLNLIFCKPIITSQELIKELKVSKETANQILNKFEELDILKEISGIVNLYILQLIITKSRTFPTLCRIYKNI